jgi:uncharacterized protein YkwD
MSGAVFCTCKYCCILLGRANRKRRGLGAMLVAILPACAGALGADPAAAGAVSPKPCRGSNLSPNTGDGPAVDAATLCLINEQRAAYHLRALRPNHTLSAVAASQLDSMVRWNYFADVRPSGQTPIALVSRTPYRRPGARLSVGQSIAWGAGGKATPARIVAAWMASPPHRELILTGGFRDAGVAASATLPSALGAGIHGAIYAIELGARGS